MIKNNVHGSRQERVFLVSDYGAEPDVSKDAGPGIRAAIQAAITASQPAVVQLDRGRYCVDGIKGERAAIMITGAANLTLRGVGKDTLLVIRNPRIGGVEVTDSVNIRLENFAVDYDPLPFTQGTVTVVDTASGTYDVAIDAGYPLPSESYFFTSESSWGLLVDNVNPKRARYGPHPLFTASWEHISDNVWRFKSADPPMIAAAEMKAGDRYVHKARRFSESAINFWRTRQANIDSITVYAGPALASIWGQNEDVKISALRVEVLPGSGRLLSANGDGIHNLGTRGSLLIEECVFEGMGDDAINIHARAGAVVAAPSPSRIVVQGDLFQAERGDWLQIYDPRSGHIRAEVEVSSSESGGKGRYIVTMCNEVDDIAAGSDFSDADHVYNLSACGQNAVIRNNYFGRHRGRGVLLKTVNAVVEHNTFENVEGWGIAIQHEPNWPEGPVAHDIIIRDNTFQGTGYGGVMPAIHIVPMPPEGMTTEGRGRATGNINIENNQFINLRNTVINACSVERISILKNRIKIEDNTEASNSAAIVLDHSAGARIEQLEVELTNTRCEPYEAVYIKANVPRGERGVHLAHIQGDPAAVPIMIRDERG